MTLNGSSQYECWKKCWTGELIMMQPGMAQFTCYYESDLTTTPTNYSWYLNDTLLPGYTTNVANINIVSGFHTVKCQAFIDDGDNCTCQHYRTIDVTVVGTQ